MFNLIRIIMSLICFGLALTLPTCSTPQSAKQIIPATTVNIKPIRTMAALGDSLTAATNACGHHDACLPQSWATGDDSQVESLAKRITGITGHQVKVHNYAHIGDKANAMANQAEKALAVKPDLVTILVGANDYCGNDAATPTTPTAFKTAINNTLYRLHHTSPTTRVLLIATLNPANLYNALKNNPNALKAWQHSGACPLLLQQAANHGTNVTAARAKIDAIAHTYARVMATACKKYENCLYSNTVSTWKYGGQYVSTVDYLHPNIDGQAAMAKQVWATRGLRAFLLNR